MQPDDADASPYASSLRAIRSEARRDFAALHEYLHVVTREISRAYEVVEAHIAKSFDPDREDLSDAYWRAERAFGANPAEVFAHTGLMLLSRGVAVSEVVFASIPHRLLVDADPVVFDGDRSWNRSRAELFYRTGLARRIKIGDGAMKHITALRDLYAHGYGRPRGKNHAERLAAGLHRYLGPEAVTAEEARLGFTEESYVFGRWTTYEPSRGLVAGPFMPIVAELSPVATRRLLLLIEERVEATLLAASWGVREPFTAENSKFVRRWEADQAKKPSRTAERKTKEKPDEKQKAAEVEARRQRDREAGLARQAELRRGAHLGE